uniref:Prefoldin subunit 5 n=2 Tax=Caenorhabditis japonica TaxID=281687 RepID=A0A8R1E0H1_CAEJA
MAEEPRGVPLTDLSIQQLSELQKNCEQELNFFQESFGALKGLLARNEKSINSLEDVKVASPGHTALIPLSESLYIRAELSDPSKHMVEIGTGYFVELEREKAKAIFDRKKEHIAKQIETVEGILKEKRRTRAYISDAFQTKVQAQLATMNTASN